MKLFETVAQMKLATLKEGQLVETKSYYGLSATDTSGAARYKIVTAAEFGGTPDGYGDHVLANGNVALLQEVNIVNVKQFGAGATQTAAENVARINAAMSKGREVFFPKEVYTVDPTPFSNVLVPSNTVLRFEEGAELQSITNSLDDYRVIQIDGVQNVTIHGGIFRGDKATHTGTTGEGGHAIACYGSTNINLYGCQGHDTWGVGLAVVNCNDFYGEDIYCDNGRQNSAAIVSGTNITLVRPIFTNASGTAPAAGIDIEPNAATDRIENIRLISPYTEGNEGAGVQVSINPLHLTTSTREVDITITDHTDKGSFNGFWVSEFRESTTGFVSGSINYLNGTSFDAQKAGILISNYASRRSPKIFIDSPTVIRPNASNDALVFNASGIAFDRAAAFPNTNLLGNIHVKNPYVVDDRAAPLMLNALNQTDFKTVGYENTLIEDPVKLEGVSSGAIDDLFKIGQNVQFTNKFGVITETITTSKALSASSAYGIFNNAGAGGIVTFNLPTTFGQDTNLTEITFIDDVGTGIRLEPLTGRNILPISPVTDKYIQSTQQGCSVTIQKRDDNTWYVKNIQGTWNVEP